MIPPLLSSLLIIISSLLSIAFFTLLERNILGYSQLRNGPNNSAITGLPQPLADAINLFINESPIPQLSNPAPFLIAPLTTLLLALLLWLLYPINHPTFFLSFSIIALLCLSSLNVYTTIGAGWASNSNYALLGSLRSVAQTISYEVSITLILLIPVSIISSLSFFLIQNQIVTPIILITPISAIIWFITILAETNRTPFDFAEGESELVSGFNTEYSSATFAIIFMAEYINILAISLFTSYIFISNLLSPIPLQPLTSILIALLFLITRTTLPRIRYDFLITFTWKYLLLIVLTNLTLLIPFVPFLTL